MYLVYDSHNNNKKIACMVYNVNAAHTIITVPGDVSCNGTKYSKHGSMITIMNQRRHGPILTQGARWSIKHERAAVSE